MIALKAMFAPASRPPAPPINSERIRTLAAEMRPLIAQQRAVYDGLNDIYNNLMAELQHADPTSQDCKDLEHLVIHFCRALGGRGTTSLLLIEQGMKEFGLESVVEPTPEKEPRHA